MSQYNDQHQQPLSDDDVYTYTLRAAMLQHVVACRRTAAATAAAASPSARSTFSTSTSNNGISPTSAVSPTSSALAAAAQAQPKRDSLRRTITEGGAAAWQSTFASMSLGDLFRSSNTSSSSSSARYPERFVRVLEQRIADISRGTDPYFKDMLLRYTVGAFYGKFLDAKHSRMFRENRKVEDLLMVFIATATDVLRKRCADDEWKVKLEGQVESFVRIIEDGLRAKEVKHVPQELFVKLDTLRRRIADNRSPPSGEVQQPANGESHRASLEVLTPLSTTGLNPPQLLHTPASPSASPSLHVSYRISDMPAVQQVARIFNIDTPQLQQDINIQKQYCTEKAAMADCKSIVSMFSSPLASFPYNRQHFASDEAYKEWRSKELFALQHEILAMIKINPDLVHSSDSTPASATTPSSALTDASPETATSKRSSRVYLPIADMYVNATGNAASPRSSVTLVQNDNAGPTVPVSDRSIPLPNEIAPPSTPLAFVPPSQSLAYKRLLAVMLSYDLAEMSNLDPTEEVSLRILSPANQDLLLECAARWRIGPTFRFTAFLDEMCNRYAAGEMPVVECVIEALGDFAQVNAQWPFALWPDADRKTYFSLLSQLFDALLRAFYVTFSEQSPPDEVPPVVEALECVHDNPLFDQAVEHEDLQERFEQLRDGVRRVADFWYAQKRDALFLQFQHDHMSILPMLELLDWTKANARRLDKKYKSPLLGAVDVPQLFLSRVPDLLLHDLSQRISVMRPVRKPSLMYTTSGDMLPVEPPQQDGLRDGEVMALYTGVKELTAMYSAFCPKQPLLTAVNHHFEPYIMRWLAETDKKTLTWVREAIKLDTFDPKEAEDSGNVGHTSSIVDLIASCKGAVQFVTDLAWPDEVQNAIFLTKLSATVSKAIEQYCVEIEMLYMAEMEPPRDGEEERDERTSAWLTRAKALMQEKKLEMFQFKPTSCLKLNNIHTARDLLDKMYSAIDADKVAALTRTRTEQSAHAQLRNLFTIKVVLGEGLSTVDGVSRVDPFITLSNEQGLRIAKTRTLYQTTEPRWSEAFDVSVEGKMWIAATAWNRNLVDEHELLGRTFFSLDPHIYGDYLPHDLWQDLDTVGRVLLRVSMEGEKDDIQFYFGRAFRSLKRAETDMTRIIVDKISPFIRSCISHTSLKSLLKQGSLAYLTSNVKNLNLDKAFDKARLDQVRKFIKSKDPHAAEIPLPPSEFSSRTSMDKPLPSHTKQQPQPGLTDAELEQPLAPLLEYLDQSLEVFRRYLSEPAWQSVMTKLWKEVLSVTESLLLPPLSDQPTEMKPLTDKEVDIVFMWLKFMTDFFYADGHGVPYEDLRNPRYRAVMNVRFYYDWSTDKLMEECVRLTNLQLTLPSVKNLSRTKSVFQQRNLGTIKQRKQDKNTNGDTGEPEMVMRILRMRPGAIDFVQQQLATLNLVQEKRPKPTRLVGSIRGRGGRRGTRPGGPGYRTSHLQGPLPPLPGQPNDVQRRQQQYR